MKQRSLYIYPVFGGVMASFIMAPAMARSAESVGAGAAQAAANNVGTTTSSRDPSEPQIGDIIVTASRRSENLQKQSRDIVALGAESLQRTGLATAEGLNSQVPGLQVTTAGAQLQVYIRGVGDRTVTAATDPAVALNVDGVYYPRAYSLNGQFYDLERVEVLRGPQGTLYGRNASAGAINLIAAKPQFEYGGFAEVEVGNYEARRFTAAITGPVSDTLAFRLSGQLSKRDGFLTDGYNDEDYRGLRGQLLWNPTDADSLLLAASYTNDDSRGVAAVISPGAPGNKWTGPSDPRTIAIIAGLNPLYASAPSSNGFQHVDTYAVTANYQHDFGDVTLTVLPAYVKSHLKTLSYAAVIIPNYQDTASKQKSLEVRLSDSGHSRLKWIVGGFASDERVNDENQTDQSVFALAAFRRLTDKTVAAFGEVTYSATDQLRLIAGARYTHEKKTVEGSSSLLFYPFSFETFSFVKTFPLPAPLPNALPIPGQRTDNAVNFRVGFEYDVAPHSMVYANVATGFKAGGFYADTLPNSYKPEKLTAYHLGIKNRFFDQRVQLNIEGYYWDYKDKQESFLGAANSGGVTLITANAASAELYGADVTLAAMVTRNDILSANIEYNHTRYGSFVYNGLTIGPGGIPAPLLVDNSGRPLVNAPLWSGRVSYEHTQELGSAGQLVFNVGTQFSSRYYYLSDFTPNTIQDSFTRTDVSLTWTSAGKGLSITAFAKNLENSAVFTGGSVSPSLPGLTLPLISPPRTYGARVRVSF